MNFRIPSLDDLGRWWFEIKLGAVVALAFAWGYAGRVAQEAVWPPKPKERKWRVL